MEHWKIYAASPEGTKCQEHSAKLKSVYLSPLFVIVILLLFTYAVIVQVPLSSSQRFPQVDSVSPRTGNNDHQPTMTERMHSKPETDALQPPSHSASTSPAPGPGGSRPSNHHRGATSMRPADSQKQQQQQQSTATSDQATIALIRRVLCSHNVLLGNGDKGRTTPRPIDEVLPPLTSSNEIDVQLYGIIAVIVKEFVQTWYAKITPDHAFVNEVVQIIAHCTRALEQRIRKVDLEALFLDAIPELLEAHLRCR